MRGVVSASLFVFVAFPLAASGPLYAQQDPDPNKPRPPVLLELTREERIATAVNLYLRQFIQAIQRADTVALASLVPEDAIPAEERRVADRAGCPSLGRSVMMLRAGRAGRAENPEMPLRMIRLAQVTVSLSDGTDTTAAATARVEERAAIQLFYAPMSFVFGSDGDAIRLRGSQGGLLGLCGLGAR